MAFGQISDEIHIAQEDSPECCDVFHFGPELTSQFFGLSSMSEPPPLCNLVFL